jgi:hypothetical protein
MTHDEDKDAIRAEMAAATAQVLRLAMTDMLTALQLLARIERTTELEACRNATTRLASYALRAYGHWTAHYEQVNKGRT